MLSRKHRYLILAIMALLTVGSLLLIPRININEDMTLYLPDDSRMKEGVECMKQNFPEVDMNAYFVKVMLADVADKDSVGAVLAAFDGVLDITASSQKDEYTMYQLSVKEGADPKAISAAIAQHFGEAAVVENNANSIMPDNMVTILIVGVIIVFGILFLMCSSLVEALLFIVTIGMAVLLNMGTNAFLPSVSMMTNTIVAVLQLVLSMDYSIILINRFRQVVPAEPDLDKAMHAALKSASPSILSSSLTTIVGLLALVFMKFKIGLDLGVVLAKGVFFSLISIYTILPTLILIFYKGIKKTEKKVWLIPTDRLAKFEYKARIPLAVLFVVIFGLFSFLSTKTELSYASIWESRINDKFPPQNAYSLLYRTSTEDNMVALADSIAAEEKVDMVISYPTLFKKQLTPERMCDHIHALLALLPNLPGAEVPDLEQVSTLLTPDNLKILYYAASHPVRDEKMSFEDMIQLAGEASKAGLLPEGMDVQAMIAKFTPPVEDEPAPVQVQAARPTPDTVVSASQNVAVTQPETDSRSLRDIAKPTVDESGEDPYSLRGKYRFTKEGLNTRMNSTELAEYLGFSKSQASAAYAMARKKNGTMTPNEFIDYMINNVLSKKLLRAMISDKQAEGLHYIREEMDIVLAAPDTVSAPLVAETVVEAQPVVASQMEVTPIEAVAAPVVAPAPKETPMDRLAEMFASGRKYSSKQIYKALHSAGIDVVDQGTLELMMIYYGSKHSDVDSVRLSLDEMIDFISTEVASNKAYSTFLDDNTRSMVAGLRGMVDEGMKMIRGEEWSMAAIVTEYPLESTETFDFVERTITCSDAALEAENCYLVGESVMYKEMKDGFRRELLFLTLLTVVSIFLIVAITFKSVIIPTILVLTVLTGVFANVFFSGLGGNTMLYLAYLIVQSILMGSTIDYGILFTNYYLGFRKEGETKVDALQHAYRGSIHTIMTSGLIIISAPFIMSELLTDPTICSILSSLTFGALAAISLILLVLPAVLTACDRKK